jgi:hypothetical protein
MDRLEIIELALKKLARYVAMAEARENNVQGQFESHIEIVMQDILGELNK